MRLDLSNAVEAAKRLVSTRRMKYRQTFKNPTGEQVLRDLAKFCYAHESTHHAEPGLSDKLEGRRQVWLRIQQQLNLTDEELWTIYRIPTAGVTEDG